MAEQKQEKKKPISVREILRWILCGLLGLLLIAAVTIRAPGKIVAFLIVLLLACAALPRRARKWFGLSTAAAVIVLAAWVFLPDGDANWRPYTFDEELAALQAKYAVPDEENAALIYDKLFETMDPDPNEPKFFARSAPSSRDELWLSKDHPETAEWLKSYQDTIGKLIQATGSDKCQFPISIDPVTYGDSIKKLSKIRNCTRLLISTANNDIAEGRIGDALEKYLCIIKIADHMYQQPAMMYHLVGYPIESLGLQRLNRFVIEGEPTTKQLQLISESFTDLGNNWSSDWHKMLDFEKLYAKNHLCSLIHEVNPEGKARLSRGRMAITSGQFPRKIPPKTYWQRKHAKAGVILGWFYFPSTPKKVSEFIDNSFKKYYEMAEPDYDWDKQPSESRPPRRINYRSMVEMLTTIPGSAYYRVHEIYLRTLSLRRGSRLLVGIRQYQIEHNAWPADLDVIRASVPAEALIDPVTEKEFTYMNYGERFSLYGETANIWPR
jgi:hypothetical protein